MSGHVVFMSLRAFCCLFVGKSSAEWCLGEFGVATGRALSLVHRRASVALARFLSFS